MFLKQFRQWRLVFTKFQKTWNRLATSRAFEIPILIWCEFFETHNQIFCAFNRRNLRTAKYSKYQIAFEFTTADWRERALALFNFSTLIYVMTIVTLLGIVRLLYIAESIW